MSSSINQLRSSPGRLVQSLEQSSLDVWGSGVSGVGRDRTKAISYYVKGPVVGLLLDARIRHATGDRKSLDDVMRLAYQRYAGERGFTPDEFRMAAEEVAGTELKDWFQTAVNSAVELDYTEALDWFGLRFAPTDASVKEVEPAKREAEAKTEPAKRAEPTRKWKLEVQPDATEAQKAHLRSLLQSTGAK
jgi:predicted metalloprotease with PDZ domain